MFPQKALGAPQPLVLCVRRRGAGPLLPSHSRRVPRAATRPPVLVLDKKTYSIASKWVSVGRAGVAEVRELPPVSLFERFPNPPPKPSLKQGSVPRDPRLGPGFKKQGRRQHGGATCVSAGGQGGVVEVQRVLFGGTQVLSPMICTQNLAHIFLFLPRALLLVCSCRLVCVCLHAHGATFRRPTP